jgi:hypothetical protein
VCVCVCSVSYTACKERVPCYISIFSLSGCNIFFLHHFINDTIFGKKLLKVKLCVLTSSIINCKMFLVLRKILQYAVIMYTVLRVKCPLFLSGFYPT